MSDNRTHFDKLNALNSSVIGFEFEFYTKLLKGRASELLSSLVKKKIVVSEKYHSKTPVDRNNFKLEPDYSGGNNMLELITGPLPYDEAMPILIKILRWIDENGWTTDRCAFQFSISFDKNRRDVKDKIENLDKLKFVLGLDENFIYSKFGSREKNVYAKSIKNVVPVNRFSILDKISSIDPMMYKVPNDKYYGVNFTKIPSGYIEFRYLGNRDYQKKIRDIREIIDYIVLYMYDLLSHRIRGYSNDDLVTLKKMLARYSKVVRSFSDPAVFIKNFPEFHLFVDLKGLEENIKTYFPVIRDKIFDLVVEGNITSCYFNYDTTTGRYQIKEARSRDAFSIDGMDLILCDIKNANIKNCGIYNCEIRKSTIDDCYVYAGTKIVSSKIKSTIVDYTNELKDCFIDCEGKNINCKIVDGVFRAGILGANSEVSEATFKVKSDEDARLVRFVTDSRLKDDNDKYNVPKFGNMNNR
jgi:hypothetical protein